MSSKKNFLSGLVTKLENLFVFGKNLWKICSNWWFQKKLLIDLTSAWTLKVCSIEELKEWKLPQVLLKVSSNSQWAVLYPSSKGLNKLCWICILSFLRCSVQYVTCSVQYAAWSVQYAVWSKQFSVWNVKYLVWNVQCARQGFRKMGTVGTCSKSIRVLAATFG